MTMRAPTISNFLFYIIYLLFCSLCCVTSFFIILILLLSLCYEQLKQSRREGTLVRRGVRYLKGGRYNYFRCFTIHITPQPLGVCIPWRGYLPYGVRTLPQHRTLIDSCTDKHAQVQLKTCSGEGNREWKPSLVRYMQFGLELAQGVAEEVRGKCCQS